MYLTICHRSKNAHLPDDTTKNVSILISLTVYTTIGYIGTHQFILDRTQKGHVRTLDENVIKHRSTVYYMILKRQIIYSEWFRRRSNVISN